MQRLTYHRNLQNVLKQLFAAERSIDQINKKYDEAIVIATRNGKLGPDDNISLSSHLVSSALGIKGYEYDHIMTHLIGSMMDDPYVRIRLGEILTYTKMVNAEILAKLKEDTDDYFRARNRVIEDDQQARTKLLESERREALAYPLSAAASSQSKRHYDLGRLIEEIEIMINTKASDRSPIDNEMFRRLDAKDLILHHKLSKDLNYEKFDKLTDAELFELIDQLD